ncbi:uncharacterized protein LOC127264081 [Andrographis paniculata]|uniref:uncharacterized protein LOC127264081 n=1 Tax=Andrographis paniculata TaxID=175694 RepID=UPI0021E8A654|nr:uncharacterized protein LOC127264081 [Andrographis paniculata]XP_051149414.1 uncharacterized protein LOC127264081 [Andrographis paniculata]XP_051149415.1 uncharacterized protein LOC127264081 [Andrographis paniculata]
MGIIKDGSISGFLPSSGGMFAVHYPGYPSSIERAVETLGGQEGILKVCSDKSNKLELHFRPEDPYSHPVFGESRPCNKFLLKISSKKVKGIRNVEEPNQLSEPASADSLCTEQNSLIPESDEIAKCTNPPKHESSTASEEAKADIENEVQLDLSADIVARVPEAYHFDGMVDYQHVLPVHADVTRRKKRNWAEVDSNFESRSLIDVEQEDLMILLPPLFSLKDIPEKVVLKPSGDPGLRKKQDEAVQQNSEMEIEQCLAIDFNIKEIPKKVDWKKLIPEDSDLWQWQTIVCELFDERPLWVKNSFSEHLLDRGLNVGSKTLKRLLFIAAYYFSNGPYRRVWIRKGYDPRKDPESRIYQRIDFRVPPSLRSYRDDSDIYGVKIRWMDLCAFKVFPRKSQILLQLIELEDDYIQEEIKKPTSQETCSLQTGWFSSRVLDCLRLRVAQRFLSVYPGAGAESLLKAVTRRFQRTKRLPLAGKNSKVNKKEKQDVKEVLEHEGTEANDEVEHGEEVEHDEEDEDEMDYDNLGEDVDADEALDQVDQDEDFLLQPDSYTDNNESASKGYLQELFGSFPLGTGVGDGIGDADDPYDDIYQIYEHYSDDNDSDDDGDENY